MNKDALIEAILFIHGEPMDISLVAGILGLKEKEMESALCLLSDRLEKDERGIELILSGGRGQLVTKKDAAHFIQKLLKVELRDDLTVVSHETLAIIAYLGPIDKGKIDYLRGVNSAHILRNLILRGLIVKNLSLYSLSFDLMRHLGITKIEDLPDYEDYRKLLERAE